MNVTPPTPTSGTVPGSSTARDRGDSTFAALLGGAVSHTAGPGATGDTAAGRASTLAEDVTGTAAATLGQLLTAATGDATTAGTADTAIPGVPADGDGADVPGSAGTTSAAGEGPADPVAASAADGADSTTVGRAATGAGTTDTDVARPSGPRSRSGRTAAAGSQQPDTQPATADVQAKNAEPSETPRTGSATPAPARGTSDAAPARPTAAQVDAPTSGTAATVPGPEAVSRAATATRTPAADSGTRLVADGPEPATGPSQVPSTDVTADPAPSSNTATSTARAGTAERPNLPAATAIDRVMRAVETLEKAPPPRQMTFDVDGVRMTVSLRGEQVHVDVRAGGDQLTNGWQRDLASSLKQRGFDLSSGQQGRDGHNGQEPQHRGHRDAPSNPAAPTRRARTDASLHL